MDKHGNLAVCPKTIGTIVSTYLLSIGEELKKAILLDGECRPELIVGRSEILDIDDISNITNNLLGNTHWTPVYSTSLHRRSLKGLYVRLREIFEQDCKSPILLLIKDTNKRVFGVLLSTIIQQSDQIYELENSILFHCRPKFEIFPNMRDNKCKVSSQLDSLSITHTGGKGNLWLNSKLTFGRTDEDLPEIIKPKIPITPVHVDEEFEFPIFHNNDNSPTPTFMVKTVECWIFGAQTLECSLPQLRR